MSSDSKHQEIIDFKTKAWQPKHMVKTYLKSTESRPVEQGTFNFMSHIYKEHIPPGSKVIDVGCGTGRLTIALADHGCEVVGSDVSQAMLDALNEKRPDIPTRCGDGHRLPAEDGEFPFVTSMDFMPHFPDWAELLKEKSRCCAEGGLVLFNFQSKEHGSVAADTGKFPHNHIYSADPDSRPESFLTEYNAQEITVACAEAGLELVTFHPYGFFWSHYNFMVGHNLGPENLETYGKQLSEFMRNDEVREFAFWIEKNLIRHLPAFLTHEHVVVCRKK